LGVDYLGAGSSRNEIKFIYFAVFAFTSGARQDFTLGISSLPARHFLVEISRTLIINVLRTTQDNPARFFPFPEA
jgi:hypothetical protein